MDILTHCESDPFDRITHHVTNLWRVWRGDPVRDLAESEAGYESAMRDLRGAVASGWALNDAIVDLLRASDSAAGILPSKLWDAVEAYQATTHGGR